MVTISAVIVVVIITKGLKTTLDIMINTFFFSFMNICSIFFFKGKKGWNEKGNVSMLI